MCHLVGYRQIYLFILTVRIIETLPDICASLQIDVSSHATKALHRITTVTVHPLGRFIVTVMLKLVSSIHPVIIQLPSLGPRFNSYDQNVRIDVHLTSSLWPRGAWVVEGLGGGAKWSPGGALMGLGDLKCFQVGSGTRPAEKIFFNYVKELISRVILRIFCTDYSLEIYEIHCCHC